MGIRSVSLAILLVWTAAAAADYFDGNSLRQLAASVNPVNVAMFRGYVAGLQDANNGAIFCVNPNVRLNQAAAVVKKYLADHPQSWHLPAHQLVVQALSRAFPCGK
jgi:hypothetical protein